MSPGQKWGLGLLVGGGAAIVVGAILAKKSSGLHGPALHGFYGVQPQLLGPRVMQRTTNNGKTTTHYRARNLPIQARVKLLQELVMKSVQDPEMRKLALQITKSCPARDGECEAHAIYDWVRRNIRYTGDVGAIKIPGGKVEGIDLFQTAGRTVEFGGGDCDDHSVLNATLLALNGINPKFRITGSRGYGDTWSHIYAMAGLPKLSPTKLFALDTTLPGDRWNFEVPYGKKIDFAA